MADEKLYGLPDGYGLKQDADGDWWLNPPPDVVIFSVPGEPLLIGRCSKATALQDSLNELRSIGLVGEQDDA